LPEGTVLHNRYQIQGVLGHGGFGVTYLALDQILHVQVAVKEYLPRQMATRAEGSTRISIYTGEAREHFYYGLEKFLEEARAVAQFGDHPNIVSARDYFQENSTAYMVMPYIEGVDFKEYLEQQGGRIPFDLALQIMLPVMDALQTVHEAGLLHRDVSPDNIYLTTGGQVKVMDFGAARYFAGEHSKSLSVVLKTGYAPPEQYRSKGKQGPWTDVYATAATLYRAVTGQAPLEALERLAEDDIAPPSQLGVAIPPEAEQALLKALAVAPDRRFQSMREFRQALLGQEAVAYQPASPPPISPSPPFSPPPLEPASSAPFSHTPDSLIMTPSKKAQWQVPLLVAGTVLAGVLILLGVMQLFKQPGSSLSKEEQKLLEQGVAQLKAKNYDAAISTLKQVVGSNPKNMKVYEALTDAFVKTLQYSEAIDWCQKSLKVQDNNAIIHNRLGYVYRMQGRYQEALVHLEKAVKLKDDFKLARFNLGLTQAHLKNMTAAEDQAKIMEKLDQTGAANLRNRINEITAHTMDESQDYLHMLRARVQSIKLYEGPKGGLPPNKREYKENFNRNNTRYIRYEVNLIYPQLNQQIDFPIRAIWYRGKSIFGNYIVKNSAKSGENASLHETGFGNEEYGSFWHPGEYRVDLFIGSKKIGSKSFTVTP